MTRSGAPVPLGARYPDASGEDLDLLKRLLTFDAAKRISARDALELEIFAEVYDPEADDVQPYAPSEDAEGQTLAELTEVQPRPDVLRPAQPGVQADDGNFDALVDKWRVRVYGACNSFQKKLRQIMYPDDDEDD